MTNGMRRQLSLVEGGFVRQAGTMREGEKQSADRCYLNPFAGAEFYPEVELLQHLDAQDPQILAIEERGTITSSYIDNASFPTNQERSINHNTSLNASSLPNLSPEVNLAASRLKIPMIGEVGNTLATDIKSTIASTAHKRSTEDSTFLNDLIESHSKGLPNGWVTEIRYSKIGRSCYKVHIDPKSGYEFRSLMDVHRYILTEDTHQCVVKPNKRNSSETKTNGRELHSQNVTKKGTPDWLPSGWVVDIRTQTGGKCHGMKKKSYYNPSAGLRFYSKVKLFQHLNAPKVPSSSKSLPNEWRMEINNSTEGTSEYKVPSSKIFEKENSGPQICHFSDNSPGLDVKTMADMRKSDHSSSLSSKGVAIDTTSCASSPHYNCSDGENSEQLRLVNELSPACSAGALPIQAIDLGEERPSNLATENLSHSVGTVVPDTENEQKKTVQKFSELVNDDRLIDIPVQMRQVHMTASELAHSVSLQQQNEDLSALDGNLAFLKFFKTNEEVSQPIKRRKIHELGSATSMVVEAIKEQYQESKQAAALKCYQTIHSGAVEQSHGAKSDVFCQLQEKTAPILDQPEQSDLVIGSFYGQKDTPFVNLVPLYELERSVHNSAESTADQEKGDAVLDQPAQSNLDTGSIYQQNDTPSVEPAPWDELERNTYCSMESSSEQFETHASEFDNYQSDPCLKFAIKMLTSDVPDFEDTDMVQQYF
ncbi:uncharacterized protein LOC122024600 [Zingiber officinale]|uniref:uncharacterized protein LOC122024600 n=1 Tax=Zingiber officinale TaxID=94328 RepID=UPI001C4C5911|nr:uncharacterized protein LOC122024600 [Zingiber officinale]